MEAVLNIDTLPTPNPEALMFKVTQDLVGRGTYQFTDRNSANEAPLARRLFSLDGVEQVLVTTRFVTVNKVPDYGWPELVPSLKGLIREHVASGDPAVDPNSLEKPVDHDSELARAVQELIDEDIRPALLGDGGDVIFLGITPEMIVQLRLIGSCSSCPSSTATLAFGIERLMIEEFPEIQGVEQIA
jgi:Fe-S cluster biogenesis protein NfuA